MNVLSVAGSQAKFEQAFEFICFAGVVQDLGDVIGWKVEVQLNGVAVGCSNHAVFNLVAAFFIGVRNGFEVPSSQPMVVASLVADGLGKFARVDPTVDVHVHVEFLGGVAKHEGEDSTKGVGFSVAHDEFAFIVANGAVGT